MYTFMFKVVLLVPVRYEYLVVVVNCKEAHESVKLKVNLVSLVFTLYLNYIIRNYQRLHFFSFHFKV